MKKNNNNILVKKLNLPTKKTVLKAPHHKPDYTVFLPLIWLVFEKEAIEPPHKLERKAFNAKNIFHHISKLSKKMEKSCTVPIMEMICEFLKHRSHSFLFYL